MPDLDHAGRPSLREFMNVRFDALRDLLNERDRRYAERDKAQGEAIRVALAAIERQTTMATNSSEKSRANLAVIVAILAVLVGVAGVVVAVLERFAK